MDMLVEHGEDFLHEMRLQIRDALGCVSRIFVYVSLPEDVLRNMYTLVTDSCDHRHGQTVVVLIFRVDVTEDSVFVVEVLHETFAALVALSQMTHELFEEFLRFVRERFVFTCTLDQLGGFQSLDHAVLVERPNMNDDSREEDRNVDREDVVDIHN